MNSTKSILTIGLLVVIVLFPTQLMAGSKLRPQKTNDIISFVGIYAGTGYSALLHAIPNTNVLGGGFGNIGVKYKMSTKKHFTFSVGLETMLLNSTSTHDNFTIYGIYNYNDAIGNSTKMDFQFAFSQYQEQHNQWSINMPILFGKDFKHSYFGLGANIRYNILGSYNTNTILTTSATDPELIDNLENIPTHHISSQLIGSAGNLSMGVEVMGMAEFGITLNNLTRKKEMEYKSIYKRKDISYQLSLFAAYGIFSVTSSARDQRLVNFDNAIHDGNNIIVPEKDIFHISNSSIFSINEAKDKAINSLTVGLKFIVSFQLNKICRTCIY